MNLSPNFPPVLPPASEKKQKKSRLKIKERKQRNTERRRYEAEVSLTEADAWSLPPPVLPVASISRDQIQRSVLLASLSGRSFEDVKFFAFSRRNTHNGIVDQPLPLLANSALLRKASPHFDFVFGSGFSEGGITNMCAPYPTSRASFTTMYDYTSDSDLEEEEEGEGEGEGEEPVETGSSSHASSKNKAQQTDAEEEESASTLSGTTSKRTPARPGRVVFLDDIAYATWKAFLFYAYYEECNFAPLKSEQTPRPQEDEPYKAPMCSPKSMYRLAHKYDIAALRATALNEIKVRLHPANILEELFSAFTSLYSEVQTIELNYLFDNMKDPGIQARLPTWLEALEEGRLPHGSAGLVASLIVKLNNGPDPGTLPGMKKCPRGCTNSNYSCQSCGRCF